VKLALLKEHAESALVHTREFVEKGEEVMPSAFIYHSDEDKPPYELTIVGLAWQNDKEKLAMMKGIVQLSYASLGTFIILDVWTLWNPNPEDVELCAQEGVKSHPDRTEALVVQVIMMGQTVSLGSQPYERQPDGSVKWGTLSWHEPNEDNKIQARWEAPEGPSI
jgi:hypothetical protein